MLNKVQLIGRLGQEPQLKYTRTGSPIANFAVATDESFIDRDGNKQNRTEWHRIVVFQKTAENCGRYLHKGSLVYVEGSLQTHKWQDQQGIDRYMTEVKAQRVVFLDKRPSSDEMAGSRYYPNQGRSDEGYSSMETGPSESYGQGYGGANDMYDDRYGSDPGSPFPGGAQGEALESPKGKNEGGSEGQMDSVPF